VNKALKVHLSELIFRLFVLIVTKNAVWVWDTVHLCSVWLLILLSHDILEAG